MTEPADDDLYTLAPDSQPKPRPTKPKLGPVAAPSVSGKLTSSNADTDALKNLYAPLWMLAGGIVIEVIAAAFGRSGFRAGLISFGIEVVAGTVLMLAGVFIAASFRQIELGKFWTAALKLAAISVVPSAGVDLLSPALAHIPLGLLFGWIGEFILYFALLGMFFDLDESDTWYCVWIIFLVRLGVYFAFLFESR